MKSKENLIPAKRTNPDSNYAYAQEMEEDSVQQVENCLEDATLLTLQKAGAAYKDRIARKRELHKPHQEGSLYRNTLEPREKKTVVREPSKTNPQGTSKQEQQRCTVQKQIEQQVKKVAREIRGVDIDQKQLRTAANTARKGKKAGQVTQRTQRMIYRAKQAAGESAEAAKKGIAVIRSAIRHWMTAMQSLAAALIAGGWVSVFIAILQEQAHDIRVNGWRDPMSVTLGEWYEYWLVTYMKDKVKQSTYMSYRGYGNKHFCVLYKIRLKKLEGRILQEFYNYKYREEGLSAKTLRNYHMALHKCLQQAVKERLIVTNPCDAVTLPSGEKPEIAAFTNEQQRALVQISYRHRYGVFVRLDLSTGLRMGELLALRWEDIDLVGAQLTVKRTINRLARYEQDEGKHSTEIVFDTPKTQNARRTIPLTRSVIEDLKRWRSIQLADQNAAGAAYQDTGFVVTNELGMYFEQRTFKDYYNRMLQDAGIGHFTFHALRHTFATRALERGMDYKTLSAILGHYSVSFTMDTYVHSMDEHKRNEMDKMDDLFGISLEISVEQQPYPVLFTVTEEGCKAFAPDFPKIQIQAGTMETALMEAKKQIQKALSQFKYPPIPTRQEDIVVPENSVLILLKTA